MIKGRQLMSRMLRRKKRKKEIESKKRIGRIPVAPPTQKHEDKSKYSRKKKHKDDQINDE